MMTTEVRNRELGTVLRYRGREWMWSWILHRITGLGVLLFLVIHVVETALVIYSPGFYDRALFLYQNPVFRIAELIIFFGVLYHATNGLRIIIQDFWPRIMVRHRQLAWTVIIVTIVGMLPVTWIMIAPLFGWAEEPGMERHLERCVEVPTAPACLKGEGANR